STLSQLDPHPLSPRFTPPPPPPLTGSQPGSPGGQSPFSLHCSGAFLPGSLGASPSSSFLTVVLKGSLLDPRLPAASPSARVKAKRYLSSPVVLTSSQGISPPYPLPIFFISTLLYCVAPKGL